MPVIFEFRNRDIYMHRTRTEVPDPSDAAFRMHLHERCELYYFISGNGYFVIEGNPYPLMPGTILLMRPGETHSVHIEPGNIPYERIAVLFSPSVVSANVYTAPLAELFYRHPPGHGNCYPPEPGRAGFIKQCFENMMRPDCSEADRAASLAVGLYSVLGELKSMSVSGEREEGQVTKGLVRDIVEYINGHISEQFNLDTLAEFFNYDKYYLNRRFSREMGSGIWDYTIKKRVHAAQQNIYLSGSVHKGYEGSGFGDYSTFWRQYKKITGLSPAEDLKLYNGRKQG
jgi:AraC-like DNA-binding protein